MIPDMTHPAPTTSNYFHAVTGTGNALWQDLIANKSESGNRPATGKTSTGSNSL